MLSDPIVITSYSRTPIGAFKGYFSNISAPTLGAASIQATLERAGLSPEQIDEVIMGCVLPAGLGQAPARQAALKAGLLEQTPCTTINKMCGSGMKAIMMAYDQIVSGTSDIMIAGGMENMTQAPYLIDKSKAKSLMTSDSLLSSELKSNLKDHMFLDGLQDAYDNNKLMGIFAEATAEKYGFDRQTQDQFALESLTRAQKATDVGWFDEEITPIDVPGISEPVSQDELPKLAKPEKIPTLKPAFKDGGTVTAANSSGISDGAATVLIMRESMAKKLNLTPVAKIVAHATHAQHPAWFTTAPVGAIEKLLKLTKWKLDQVDLFEINEAFAVVTLAAMKNLFLSHDKVNVHGGACALGHPIGASGARIVATLISALKRYNKKTGIASLCIGGGEATALAIELV